jgi:hypothetical protein
MRDPAPKRQTFCASTSVAKENVISTEAAHTLIVSRAAEKSAVLPLLPNVNPKGDSVLLQVLPTPNRKRAASPNEL